MQLYAMYSSKNDWHQKEKDKQDKIYATYSIKKEFEYVKQPIEL